MYLLAAWLFYLFFNYLLFLTAKIQNRVFWHKLMRRAFIGHAAFLIHDIFRLRQDSPISYPAIILVSFLTSGAIHAFVSPLNLDCAGPRVLTYYCLAGVLILCENELGRLYVKMKWPSQIAEKNDRVEVVGHHSDSKWCCIAGYFWVVFFHLWTTAKLVYPNVFCAQDKHVKAGQSWN